MTKFFTTDHEWISLDGNVATIGVTTHAQEQLGDIVFVSLPEVGAVIARGDSVAVVESVKAASDVYTPVTGKVVAVNPALSGEPALVNTAAEGDGWFFKVEIASRDELADLMDADAYATFSA